MNPNQHYMLPFWEQRLNESSKAVEIALARLALYNNPNQLKLFDPSKVQSEA